MNAKIKKEMLEHPERFDFGDVPTGSFSPKYSAKLDAARPAWLTEMIIKRSAETK
jgi:hypothetical protein